MSQPAFFAILSDIHSNLDALDAVLADMAKWPVRTVFCLGDVVGYGPEPAACVDKIREISAVTIMGNHEAMLPIVGKYGNNWHETVAAPLMLANKLLSDEQKEWIRKLPLSALLDPITLSHGSLHEPAEFHYIDSTEEAEAHFAALGTAVSFQGHTHVPVVWEEREKEITGYLPLKDPVELDETCRYAINVGSVGQPRDDDPRASYVLYDYEQRLLLHRRVEYDLDRAQVRYKEAGLPVRNATRLRKGR